MYNNIVKYLSLKLFAVVIVKKSLNLTKALSWVFS